MRSVGQIRSLTSGYSTRVVTDDVGSPLWVEFGLLQCSMDVC